MFSNDDHTQATTLYDSIKTHILKPIFHEPLKTTVWCFMALFYWSSIASNLIQCAFLMSAYLLITHIVKNDKDIQPVAENTWWENTKRTFQLFTNIRKHEWVMILLPFFLATILDFTSNLSLTLPLIGSVNIVTIMAATALLVTWTYNSNLLTSARPVPTDGEYSSNNSHHDNEQSKVAGENTANFFQSSFSFLFASVTNALDSLQSHFTTMKHFNEKLPLSSLIFHLLCYRTASVLLINVQFFFACKFMVDLITDAQNIFAKDKTETPSSVAMKTTASTATNGAMWFAANQLQSKAYYILLSSAGHAAVNAAWAYAPSSSNATNDFDDASAERPHNT